MSREMKDSGIKELGYIPDRWSVQKLKFSANIVRGGSPRPIEAYITDKDGYNWVKIGDATGNGKYINSTHQQILKSGLSKTRLVHPGTLLLTNSMSFGHPYVLNIDGCIHDGWLAFSDYKEIDQDFLYYFLLSSGATEQFGKAVDGSVVSNLNIDKVKNAKISIPSVDEQRQIVSFLDRKCSAIDTAIEKTKESIEKLEEYKKAVITKAVTKGLDPDAKMKDFGGEWVGEIPESWAVVKTKYLFQILKRIAGKEGYDVISITQGGLKVKDIKSNEGQLADNYSKYQFVFPGDFAMNHMDLLTGWIDLSVLSGVTSPDYRVFRRIKDSVNNDYYKYLFQSLYFNKIYYGLAQGIAEVGRKRLQAPVFKEVKLPFPSPKEQAEIVKYINDKCTSIDALIAKKQEAISKWEEYKKSLIYYAVTGKIDCREEKVDG